MFLDKPVFGFGPGTYMFKYGPYQNSGDKTIISTNAGDAGNAHSEYLGPLAESGIIGMLSYLAIIVTTLFSAAKVFHKARSKKVRMIAMACITGLSTYYVHGFLNNFLDTDKASALFWGFMAIIVTLELYHLKIEDEEPKLMHPTAE